MASTGDWDQFRQEPVGAIRLDAGVSQLTFRSAGKVRPASYLLDLKAVYLKPLPAGKAGAK